MYNCNNEKASFVNCTNDGIDSQKFWYAVVVQMNCEKSVSSKLTKLGILNYVAIQRETHQWSDRRKRIDRIVIPMIVFVRITARQVYELKKCSFILKFLKYPGVKDFATPIPDEQIERLKYILNNSNAKVSIIASLNVGDMVRVIKGPLKGIEGELAMIDGIRQVVAIRLYMLGYAYIELSKDCIELVDASSTNSRETL